MRYGELQSCNPVVNARFQLQENAGDRSSTTNRGICLFYFTNRSKLLHAKGSNMLSSSSSWGYIKGLKRRVSFFDLNTYTSVKNFSNSAFEQVDHLTFPGPKTGDMRYLLGSH